MWSSHHITIKETYFLLPSPLLFDSPSFPFQNQKSEVCCTFGGSGWNTFRRSAPTTMPPAPTRILVRSACFGELGARRTRLPPSACCRRRRVCRKASPEDGFGPASPPEQPQWLKDLYKQAEDFPEEEYLQELLRDTGGDPAKIEANARRKLAESVGRESNPQAERQQHDLAQMHVRFSQVDPFNLWIWLEFYSEPSEAEQEMLSSVLDAWFILGKLGSFNTVNLQLSNSFEHSASFFEYDDSQLDTSLPAAFHEMEQPEFR